MPLSLFDGDWAVGNQMDFSRVVRVAVTDGSGLWSEFARDNLSGFSFPLVMTLPDMDTRDKGANLSIEFVPDDDSLLYSSQFENDPYRVCFLNLYVLRTTPKGDIPEDQVVKLQRWLNRDSLMGSSWHVFVFQEERLVPVSLKKSVLRRAGIAADRDVTVLPFKPPFKPLETNAETVKNELEQDILESMIRFEADVREKIASLETQEPRFRVWRSLLVYYYGYVHTALKLFTEVYDEMVSDNSWKIEGMLPPLEPNWITHYPLTNGTDFFSVLVFCLSGIMASLYAIGEHMKCYQVFLKHWALLQSRCQTETEKQSVRNWAIQAFEVLIDIPFKGPIVRDMLYMMFLLSSKESSAKMDRLYHEITTHLQDYRYTRAAVNVLYSDCSIFNDETENWSFGIGAAVKLLREAIQSSQQKKVQFYATKLFEKRRVDEQLKRQILEDLYGTGSELELTFTMPAKIRITGVKAGPIRLGQTIHIKVRVLSSCFPYEFDSVELFLSNLNNHSLHDHSVFVRNHIDIRKDTIEFETFFPESGRYQCKSLCLTSKSLVFILPIDNDWSFDVIPFETPKIDVTFPHLVSPSQPMKLTVTLDVATLLKASKITINFDGGATFPNQTGKTENCQIMFHMKDSVLTFQGTPIGCDSVIFHLTCSIDHSSTPSSVIARISVNDKVFEHIVPVQFVFPIECRTRVLTDEFVHILLRNVSPVSLEIAEAKYASTTWGRQVIDANQDLFLLAPRDSSSDLELRIREGNVEVTKSFEIGEQTLIPVLHSSINPDNEPLVVGKPFVVKVPISRGDRVNIEQTSEILIDGKYFFTSMADFTHSFRLIPLRSGLVKLPLISINRVTHVLEPEYVHVMNSSVQLVSPMVISSQNV